MEELKEFFSKNSQENTKQMQRRGFGDELEVSEIPEEIRNNLRQVSDLLKDING